MLFEDKFVKKLFFREITPTEFAENIFYYVIEMGQVEFKKSTFVDLQLPLRYKSPYYIYLFAAKGNGVITINHHTFGIKKNDTLLFSTLDDVNISSEMSEFYYLIFQGNNSDQYYDYLMSKEKYIKFIDNSNIKMHFYKIKECLTNTQQAINESYISVSIECIFAEVYTIINFNQPIGKQVNMVTLAIDYIEDHFMKDINLDDICKNIMYSPYHFSRIFKKETGMSPYEYLIHRRLNYAKHLLVTTNQSITRISNLCGYKSNIHFSNSFKKNLGITPKQYRIQNQIKKEEMENET